MAQLPALSFNPQSALIDFSPVTNALENNRRNALMQREDARQNEELTLRKDQMQYQRGRDQKLDAVIGIESRGFILGAAMALELGVGFVPVRKPGKLPGATLGIDDEHERAARVRVGGERAEVRGVDLGRRDAFGGEQIGHDPATVGSVEMFGRFVEQHRGRRRDEGAGQQQPAPLPGRHRGGPTGEHRRQALG